MHLPKAFQPKEYYRPPDSGYRLLPFRFLRWNDKEVLVVNEVGQHVYLSEVEFAKFAEGTLSQDCLAYESLKGQHFLADSDSLLPLGLLAIKWRTKKAHLVGFTKLHMFVVTLRCDHSCRYCQVSRVTADRATFDMTRNTASKALDLVFRSPSQRLKIEFQGGEPLLNFELIQFVVEQALERNAREGRLLEFVVATNLVPLTAAMLDFISVHGIFVSTSLDGPAHIHNANRPRPENDSHEIVIDRLARVRERLGRDRVSAIMTTTERSLGFPEEIVDEYARLEFGAIFLRPISPYGFALRTGEFLRYQMNEFLDFYERGLNRVIELNRQGVPMVEVYAQIILSKILTPFAGGYVDLQSPAGAVIGGVAYNYDGRIYASDEARMLAAMGDETFCLGRVEDSYEAIFASEVVQALVAGSVLESLPGCTDCAFLPYCGGDPVFHYRTQGDIVGHKATSAFCHKNMTIIRLLLERLREGDDFTRSLLASWATGVPMAA